MKVICIDTNPSDGYITAAAQELLKEGEVYTVLYETVSYETNKPIYILKEVQSDTVQGGWRKHRFIPLSNIDEKELVEQRLQTA